MFTGREHVRPGSRCAKFDYIDSSVAGLPLCACVKKQVWVWGRVYRASALCMGMEINVMGMEVAFSQRHSHSNHVISNCQFYVCKTNIAEDKD